MRNSMSRNPWRSPDWRWTQAMRCVDGPPVADPVDNAEGGKWIVRTSRFIEELRQCENDPDLESRLERDHPSMFWAYALYSDPSLRRARFALEARILAGRSNQEIAQAIDCDEQVIETFEAVFFHVREKLASQGYVADVVFAESAARGPKDREIDLYWKLVAYFCGPQALEAVIAGGIRPQQIPDDQDITVGLERMRDDMHKLTIVKAAFTAGVDEAMNAKLTPAIVTQLLRSQNRENGDQGHTDILSNIDAMLTSLPFGVGTKAEDLARQGPLMQYDGLAAELRTDELLLAAAGFELPHDEEIKNLTFPPEAESPEAVSPT
jgi:hypothetical protein